MGILRRRRFPRHRRHIEPCDRPDTRLRDGDTVTFPGYPRWTDALAGPTMRLPIIGPPPPTDSVRLVRGFVDPELLDRMANGPAGESGTR